MCDLGAGCELERGFPDVEKRRTFLRRRHVLQQRPKRMPMHHADTVMPLRPERQSVHIAAPAQCTATGHIVSIGHSPW